MRIILSVNNSSLKRKSVLNWSSFSGNCFKKHLVQLLFVRNVGWGGSLLKLNVFNWMILTLKNQGIKCIWLAKSLQFIFFITSVRILFIDRPVSEISLACQPFLKVMHNPSLKELRFPTKGTLLTCFQQPESDWWWSSCLWLWPSAGDGRGDDFESSACHLAHLQN